MKVIWTGYVDMSDAYKMLIGKPERKRSLGRPRYR